MQDRDQGQRPGESEADIHRPTTASSPTSHGLISPKGAATLAAGALLVGAALGWVGSAVTDDSGIPDLQALCVTLGELDVAVLDRIENVDIGDPNLARLGALQPLATAAASHPDVPEALAQTGRSLSIGMGRIDIENVREQLGELRQYC